MKSLPCCLCCARITLINHFRHSSGLVSEQSLYPETSLVQVLSVVSPANGTLVMPLLQLPREHLQTAVGANAEEGSQ